VSEMREGDGGVRCLSFLRATISNNLHTLADEWLGLHGGHAHLKKGELIKALFDALALIYLTVTCLPRAYRYYLKLREKRKRGEKIKR